MTDYTITCERCGAGVPAGANTCPSCGAPVGASGYETRKIDAGWSEPEVIIAAAPEQPEYEPTIKVPEPEAPKSPPPEPVPPVYIPPASMQTPLPTAPKKSRVWQIVAGCVALTVICCCLMVVAGVVAALQLGWI